MSHDDRAKAMELLPLLQSFADFHPDPTLQDMAIDLRIAIATQGVVTTDMLKSTSNIGDVRNAKMTAETSDFGKSFESPQPTESSQNIKHASVTESTEESMEVENGDSHLDHRDICKGMGSIAISTNGRKAASNGVGHDSSFQPHSNGTSAATNGSTSQKNGNHTLDSPTSPIVPSSTVEGALQELLDPLVPVRGHALITLRKLLEANDKEAMQKQDLLLSVFHENLAHGDSYIYLAAIQGMSALADKLPDKLLPLLVMEYAACSAKLGKDVQGSKVTRSAEMALKIGEVLMKTCRNLGETLCY